MAMKRPSPTSEEEDLAQQPVKKAHRTHEENQERAYIAASRRTDRDIHHRMRSAKKASDCHRKRTGRGLKITHEAVLGDEQYESEEEDHPTRRYSMPTGTSAGFTAGAAGAGITNPFRAPTDHYDEIDAIFAKSFPGIKLVPTWDAQQEQLLQRQHQQQQLQQGQPQPHTHRHSYSHPYTPANGTAPAAVAGSGSSYTPRFRQHVPAPIHTQAQAQPQPSLVHSPHSPYSPYSPISPHSPHSAVNTPLSNLSAMPSYPLPPAPGCEHAAGGLANGHGHGLGLALALAPMAANAYPLDVETSGGGGGGGGGGGEHAAPGVLPASRPATRLAFRVGPLGARNAYPLEAESGGSSGSLGGSPVMVGGGGEEGYYYSGSASPGSPMGFAGGGGVIDFAGVGAEAAWLANARNGVNGNAAGATGEEGPFHARRLSLPAALDQFQFPVGGFVSVTTAAAAAATAAEAMIDPSILSSAAEVAMPAAEGGVGAVADAAETLMKGWMAEWVNLDDEAVKV